MRKIAAAIAGLALIALMVPASGDGEQDKDKRDYETERVSVKIMFEGLDGGKKQVDAVKSALKSKFKRQATTGATDSGVLLKVRHKVSVRRSDIARVLTSVGRRFKSKFVVTDAELKGKVELKIKPGKVKPTPEQVAQLLVRLKKIKGLVVQGDPKRAISPLRLMCADPGSWTSEINDAVVAVFELEDDVQTITEVTWFGPRGSDPRTRPVRGGTRGSKH